MFGEQFRTLRKQKGITQHQAAEALLVSAGTVAMWEIGKRTPGHAMLLKIADYFAVSTDFLLGRMAEHTPLPLLREENAHLPLGLEEPVKQLSSGPASPLSVKLALFGEDLGDEAYTEVLHFADYIKNKYKN